MKKNNQFSFDNITSNNKPYGNDALINCTGEQTCPTYFLPKWIVKIAKPSRMVWLAPLIGFILAIPSFFSGYSADDHILKQNTTPNSIYTPRPVWDYFNLVSSETEIAHYQERGLLAWWVPDKFQIHFFRPLASVIHSFQFRFFADSPWIMHIGLGLLYALLIYICLQLLMVFSVSPIAIGTAILLFTVNDTNAYSVGWISSYNTMLGGLFGLFALLMHHHWRSRKSFSGLFLFIVAFLFALAGSEGALALIGYLVAYALFKEQGTVRSKALSLIPGATIATVYVLFYFSQHFGCKGSDIYVSPGDNLLGSVFTMIGNTVMLSVLQMFSLPPLQIALPTTDATGMIVSFILFVVIVYIFRDFLVKNKTIAFYGSGMFLSLVPFSLALPADRTLIWAGLGTAGLLGELLTSQTLKTNKLLRRCAKTLFILHFAVSLIFFVPALFFPLLIESGARMVDKSIPLENTVILNSPADIVFFYPPALRSEKGGTWPEHYYFLYAGEDTLTVKRTDNTTLQVTPSKGWFHKKTERFTRSRYYPLHKDDSVSLELMTAKIITMTKDNRPHDVRFTFKDDMSTFKWFRFTRNGLVHCELPPVGNEMKLIVSSPE